MNYHFDKQTIYFVYILTPQYRKIKDKKYHKQKSPKIETTTETGQTVCFFKKNPQKNFTEIIISIIL